MEYVTSADGTQISYERFGTGPPLVLVHGTLSDRTTWGMVRGAFSERHTVYAIDRRGRNESGLPAPHALEREFEDVAAVIEAAGEPVDLLGHSFGAHCAMGAAAMIPEKVKHLVLYEPPSGGPAGANIGVAFRERLAAGDESGAVASFVVMATGMPEQQVEALQKTPFWQTLVAFAPTIPPEGDALINYDFDPQRFAVLKMPALFLVGSQTEQQIGEVLRHLRPAMPQAEWVTFEGQGHMATLTVPKLFADTVLEFLAR